jgi:putative polyketide hydroxylase
MTTVECPVLIVGGGVAGLSSATFLASHGVRAVLVERHPDLLIHPRARGLTARTMEVYRQVGLEQPILREAYAGPEFTWSPILTDTLADETYTLPDEPQEDDGSGFSPSPFGPIDQDKLEMLVRDKARELGADLRFNTELTSFEQDDDGVTATVVDRATGQETTIRARYLIAADGVHSPVRTSLGVETDGPGALFSTITAIVDADLNPALRGRAATIAYLQKPQPFTILMAHDDAGKRWVFGTGYDPRFSALEDYTDERVAELVRAAAGLPDVEVTLRPQIPGTDIKVLAFPIVAQVARRFRTGRAFLVGDAAHSWPPTGGLGANTGIQDTHNLAWKLAAVLDGRADEALLDTYHDERHPTAVLTMGQAMARFGTRMADGAGPDVIDYGAVSMGYRYPAGATDTAALLPRELAGQPGTRAPHREVTLDGRPISTLDLYGRGFILLTGPDGGAWADAAAGLDVEVYRFGDRLAPAEVAKAHGIEDDGAVLVRPDGFVAWRSTAAGSAGDLEAAMKAMSGHRP